MAVPRQHLKTLKISQKGQITVSSQARKSLGVSVGDPLMEIVLDGCVVYIPADKVLSDLMFSAQAALESTGISVEALKNSVESRKNDNLSKRYPGLKDAQTS